MALSDVLPNRPLTSEEFTELQDSGNFDQVQTGDRPGETIDTIIITVDGTEHMLHFTPQGGWHQHDH